MLYYKVYLLLYLCCNNCSRFPCMTVSPGTSYEIRAWLDHCSRTSFSTTSHRAPPVRRVGCCFLKEKYIIINLKFIVIPYGILGFFLNLFKLFIPSLCKRTRRYPIRGPVPSVNLHARCDKLSLHCPEQHGQSDLWDLLQST